MGAGGKGVIVADEREQAVVEYYLKLKDSVFILLSCKLAYEVLFFSLCVEAKVQKACGRLTGHCQ